MGVMYNSRRIKALEENGGGSGGSTVSVSQTLTSGTEIGAVTVDGTETKLYAPTPSGGGGSTVSVSQTLTSGTEIGAVTVDGVETKLYAPTDSGGSGGSETLTAPGLSMTGLFRDRTTQTMEDLSFNSVTLEALTEIGTVTDDNADLISLSLNVTGGTYSWSHYDTETQATVSDDVTFLAQPFKDVNFVRTANMAAFDKSYYVSLVLPTSNVDCTATFELFIGIKDDRVYIAPSLQVSGQPNIQYLSYAKSLAADVTIKFVSF